MNTDEIAVAFECGGNALIGVIHKPEKPASRGVLAIVAGGPQYRGGCCRQLVSMARAFADKGFPVMRFDHTGLGDSSGEYLGYEHFAPDLDAAISEFKKAVPELEEVVLWGGCNAASAALIHGPYRSDVTGMILSNPWVHTDELHARVLAKHYYWSRLKDRNFWKKVFSLKFDFISSLKSFLVTQIKARKKSPQKKPDETKDDNTDNSSDHFTDRMLSGASRFQGRILLLVSGLSIVSKELDELMSSSREWKAALQKQTVSRVDFPDADQTFATLKERHKQINESLKWLMSWH